MPTANPPITHKYLGDLIARYGSRKRRLRELILWPIPGFILSIVLIVTGIDWYYYGYTMYGPVAATSWSQNWLFWGLLIGSLTLGASAWQIYRSRVYVELYRYGIEVKNPGQPAHVLRWEDITGIASAITQDQFLGHSYRTSYYINVLLTHGKHIHLDNRIHNLTELTTRLKANLYPRLLPGLRMQFKTGHPISFGPIQIQSRYIVIRDDRFPWERIKHITVLSGHLVVDAVNSTPENTKRFRLPVHQIPNLELLLQLLDQGSIETQ